MTKKIKKRLAAVEATKGIWDKPPPDPDDEAARMRYVLGCIAESEPCCPQCRNIIKLAEKYRP